MEADDGSAMVHVSIEQVPSVVEAVHEMDPVQPDVPMTVHMRAPDDVTGEMTAEQVVTMVTSGTAEGNLINVHGAETTAAGDDESALVPTVTTEAEDQYTEGESVLQLNLTGESLQKFAKILHEKGLQTAEDAIQYFYTLHNKNDDEPPATGSQHGEGASSQVESEPKPKKKIGRPRRGDRKATARYSPTVGGANQGEEEEEDLWDDTSASSLLPDNVSKMPGLVVVDGVRKSTRKRKNPYSKSEYVPMPKMDVLPGDSELEEDAEDWELTREEEEDYDEDEDADVDVGGGRAGSPSPAIVPSELPDVALAGDTVSPGVKVIQAKRQLPAAQIYRGKKKLTVNGKKAGRPRKKPKEAMLWPDEEETKTCRKCGEQFETLPRLRSHKASVHGRPGHPYFCEHCDYTAMFECDMKRHQRCHETGKRFKCDICDFATNWERSFQVHQEQIHKDKEPWKCDKCDTKIYNHHKVLQHQLGHNPNAFKCTHCDLLFETLSKQQWHIDNQHSDKNKHKCGQCAYTTSSSVNYRLHMKNKHQIEIRVREKVTRRKPQLICEVCNKPLLDEPQKEVHMQIHEPDNTDLSKPFYCNVCDARSSDMNLMVRHRAIHTDEKPFHCSHCEYKTRWKKDLKTHELIHTGEKSVRCPHCNYSCYTRQRLRAHLIKHDESRHHICPLCNMAFKSKQALRMHTMYHTGDAQFACDMCDFRTVTEMRLRKHKLRHTDERNYSCNLCGKRFKQPHHVTQHRDIVHLGKPSYRERKRIALQQSAAEALGSLNTNDVNFSQTYTVLNEDGSTTLVDLQAVQQQAQAAQRQDDTQYVMVETPAGYQYVAVVMPEDSQQPTVELQPTLVGDASQVSAEANNTLEDAQILLSQATGVYYTTSAVPVGAENNQAVDALVALQPQ